MKGAGGCCIDDLQCFPTKHEHDWKKNRIEHFEFSIYHGEIFLPFREIRPLISGACFRCFKFNRLIVLYTNLLLYYPLARNR
jgi:hypothetical protein